ncbi:Protein_disulfide isomerase PDI4 [Hexamita inflata]|uniref:Protein disulfide isomerase PDI4 n=1 Tax=Hexamita inflata TaxID=28002 RepID=A0AA86P9I5_9EUKA|nr:Protein disulfide isomerase PDI4 [Hexamita inflata]
MLQIVLAQVSNVTSEQINNSQTHLFIKFYAPWCSHCKALAPKFEQLAEMHTQVQFAQVDCVANPDLCKSFKVSGYPVLKLKLPNGTFVDYKNLREVAQMNFWLSSFISEYPPRIQIDELKKQAQILELPSFFILQTTQPELYQTIFEEFRGKQLISVLNGSDKLSVIRDGAEISFKEEMTIENIRDFIMMHQLSMFTYLNVGLFGKFVNTGFPALIVYGDEEKLKNEIQYLKALSMKMSIKAQFGFLKRDDKSKDYIKKLKGDPEKNLILCVSYKGGEKFEYQVIGDQQLFKEQVLQVYAKIAGGQKIPEESFNVAVENEVPVKEELKSEL